MTAMRVSLFGSTRRRSACSTRSTLRSTIEYRPLLRHGAHDGGSPSLFISHNKITMEMAAQLIGITMPDPGVSRVVAVDIAEALELAETLPREVATASR